MNTGEKNPKQLAVLGGLGIVLVGAIGYGAMQVLAPGPPPAAAATPPANGAPPAGGANPAAASPAAASPAAASSAPANGTPASAGGTPAAGAGGTTGASDPKSSVDALVVPLPPGDLRNPFQGPDPSHPAGAAPGSPQPTTPQPGAEQALSGPARTLATNHAPALAPKPRQLAVAPHVNPDNGVATRMPTWSLPPVQPVQQYYPRPQPRRVIQTVVQQPEQAPVQPVFRPAPAGPTLPAPVAIPVPPDPEVVFEADANTLKNSLVVRGVLVGDPSVAFVTIDGKEQVVHSGDQLPGGFVVASISDQGIEAIYSKNDKLKKMVSIGL